jgi:hypothetical protein
MTEWSLKPLTDTCWILHKDGSNHSMLNLTPDGLKAIGPIEKKLFASTDELESHLGSKVTIEVTERDDEQGDEIGNIQGYPVKHRNVFDIEEHEHANGLLISYAKASKSKTRFAAGYFAINFEHGWTASYCPRWQTLEEHGFIGPFYSKLEMQNAVSAEKRKTKI